MKKVRNIPFLPNGMHPQQGKKLPMIAKKINQHQGNPEAGHCKTYGGKAVQKLILPFSLLAGTVKPHRHSQKISSKVGGKHQKDGVGNPYP